MFIGVHIGVYRSLIFLLVQPFNTTHFIFSNKYVTMESTVCFIASLMVVEK